MANLAKYQILEKIGVGGFGVVFKGYDPFIKRHVAIKTCTAEDPETRDRFVREAEIAGNLHHRNIVTVYDFGFDEGTPYIVQEYLGGEDLDRKIKRREFVPLPAKILWLVQIARGLQYAHARGVIHRDIKPGNIRILEDDTAKIMDFGIARFAQQQSSLTQDGITLGTAAYLAPEQIRGEKIDARTDIFSFGILAYELLAYERPFQGAEISTVFYQLLNDEPAPLQERAPDTPPELAEAVARCLRKEPAERYLSSSDLLHELEGLAHRRRIGEGALASHVASTLAPTEPLPSAGTPGSSRPLSAGDVELDAARPIGRPPASVLSAAARSEGRRGGHRALGALALLALLAGGAWGYWRYRQETTPIPYRRSAEAPPPAAATRAAEPPAQRAPEPSVAAPQETRPVTADAGAATQTAKESAPAALSSPQPEPPPIVEAPPPEPAHLTIEPGWDSSMTVRVAGHNWLLDRARRLDLAAGSYKMRFALDTPQYAHSEEVSVRLGAGERRTVVAPIARPGKLTVQPHLDTRQGFLRLDGGTPESTPLRGRWLAPGRHRLEIAASSDAAAPALLSEMVTIESDVESVFTFDLDGHLATKRSSRPLLPN